MEYIEDISGIQRFDAYIRSMLVSDIKYVINTTISDNIICSEFVKSIKYALGQDGKWKRAMLLYLARACLDSKDMNQDLKYIAASIEIMHTASLIHDDIIDGGMVRRGKDSVIKKFGLSNALITGDYLIFASMKVAAIANEKLKNGNKIMNKMNNTYCDLCFGQAFEEQLIGNLECTVEQYLEVIRLKTAVFFEMVCEVAALHADEADDQIEALKGFGRNLGMAYQIRDDVLSFIEDKKHSDKSNTSDLERKLMTLPIIFAYQSASEGDKKLLKKYFMSNLELDLKVVSDIIHRTNAIEQAKLCLNSYVKVAKHCLDEIPEGYAKSLLIGYADSLLI